MKSTYEALLSVAKEVPTTIIRGNHDYKLWKKVKNPVQVTYRFVSENIFYCHGWRFYVEQMFWHWLCGWLVDQFPCLYQNLLKNPFELKNEKNYHLRVEKIHEKQESSSTKKAWII